VADTHTPEGRYRGVPEYVFDNIAGGAVLSHQTRWDELAAKHTGVHNGVGPGYWVVTEAEAVQAALQDYRTFSSTSVTALDANPRFLWIPEMLDPPLAHDLAPSARPRVLPERRGGTRGRDPCGLRGADREDRPAR
jgi:hypothetical protein